jgi:restriction system protein
MAIGDNVVWRPKGTAVIHLGEVTGPYVFDPAVEPEYPNRRPVKWLRKVPVTAVTQGALSELGSALTFFGLKNFTDEWSALLVAKGDSPVVDDPDEIVAAVTEASEQVTRDFVRKRLARDLKGHPFSQFVAAVIRTMGYRTIVSPPGADGGVDIVAHKDELGFVPPVIRVQVKSTEGTISGPTVAELQGNLAASEFGLFVTMGTFTAQARSKANAHMRLVDGERFINLVLAHYEDIEPAYQRQLPLRRMYVPQTFTED